MNSNKEENRKERVSKMLKALEKRPVYYLSSSESDLVGDHYSFMRTMNPIGKYIKMLIDKRYFLEAIGTIYMRISDNIESCAEMLAKHKKVKLKPKMMAGRYLQFLKDNGIIDQKIYETTRRFIDVRNDINHHRWDGTIKSFRSVCNLGIKLEGFFSHITYDFLEFESGNRCYNDKKR